MDVLAQIRKKQPHIYNITNEVAENFVANGLIAIGASPSMSNTPREAVESAHHADAVVINLGTLTEERAEAMLLAGKAANEENVPVILDPIAIGATSFRTNVIEELLRTVNFTAICANAGEIAVLAGKLNKTDSPDSAIDKNDPHIAIAVAKKYDTVVIATGETDIITDGDRLTLGHNGHEMLQNITASGCLLTSLIGAFSAVTDNVYKASIQATTGYGIAAERAMQKAAGPGTFIPSLLDELYSLTGRIIANHQDIEETRK